MNLKGFLEAFEVLNELGVKEIKVSKMGMRDVNVAIKRMGVTHIPSSPAILELRGIKVICEL